MSRFYLQFLPGFHFRAHRHHNSRLPKSTPFPKHPVRSSPALGPHPFTPSQAIRYAMPIIPTFRTNLTGNVVTEAWSREAAWMPEKEDARRVGLDGTVGWRWGDMGKGRGRLEGHGLAVG